MSGLKGGLMDADSATVNHTNGACVPTLAEDLVRLLATSPDLPTLPETVLDLMGLLRREDVASSEITERIRRDPALSARILRAANGAAIARAGVSVATVESALARLGLRRVGSLCLAVETIRAFDGAGRLDHRAFWEHSFTVASVAVAIGEAATVPDSGDLYMAGLLHDVGLLVLDQRLPAAYEQVVDEAPSGVPRSHWEREVLGMDHGGIAAHLLGRWSMPETMVAAVGGHHASAGVEVSSAGALVLRAAEGLIVEYGLALEAEEGWQEDVDAALRGLGLTPERGERLRVSLAGVAMESAGLLRATV